MGYSNVINLCKESLLELDAMVAATENEVISGDHGINLITDNVNFFTKSFLITLCAHLEMGIKDVVYSIAQDIDSRLTNAAVPLTIVEWRYSQKSKKSEKNGASSICTIGLTKKEIDDMVSGNVYKTKDSLSLVGIDLASNNEEWNSWKELIQSIVTRRNNIVHHNDDASDLSFGDIRSYINNVMGYLDFIDSACCAANK